MLLMKVAGHDAPIKTCHWIHTPKLTCLMTGSMDKTVKLICSYNFQMKLKLIVRHFHRSSYGIFVLSNRLRLSNCPRKFTALT